MAKRKKSKKKSLGARRRSSPDIDAARHHFQSGNFQEAAAVCRGILGKDPNNAEAVQLFGLTALQTAQYDLAMDLLKKSVNLRPEVPNYHNNLGLVFQRMGQLENARKCFFNALQLNPCFSEACYNLGTIFWALGKTEAAVKQYQEALRLNPNYAEVYNNLGNIMRDQSRLDEAQKHFEQACALNPHLAEVHNNLGNILQARGQLQEAVVHYQEAIRLRPNYARAYNNMGLVLQSRNKLDAAIDHYRQALSMDPHLGDAYNNLGSVLSQQGKNTAAVQAYRQAIRCSPENEEFKANLSDACRRLIPSWHFPMLADHPRNEAYERAIKKAVGSGDVVLDIGTGSGLLAMMAARAGAGCVIGCEMIEHLADVAGIIVKSNGYEDRVSVIAKKSTDLNVGKDLPAPATVVIFEIFDAGLIGEGLIPVLNHAVTNLAVPGATLIPAGATVWGMLIECPKLRQVNPVDQVCGFDLSEFNLFRDPSRYMQIHLEWEEHRVLSEPFEIVKLDFANLPVGSLSKEMSLTATDTGTAHAIAIWFDLYLDSDIILSTRPGDMFNHWGQAAQFFKRDHPVSTGDTVHLRAGCNDAMYMFQLTEELNPSPASPGLL